ncbi:MAG: SDR family NAD(P)-dependent oxidoreductase [Armatimonadota bacterium]
MSGRVVIVTGASSGIGEATARAFASAGDRVVLAARRIDRLNALAAELPDSLPVAADLSKTEDIARLVEAALARYGAIDVLVNNAGLGRYDWLERIPADDIRTEVGVNLVAPILLARAVLPAMQSRGRGVIINVCSVAGKIATPTTSIYNAAKFGIDGFSQALRREALHQGIQVCVIYPGSVAGTEFGSKPRPGSTRIRVAQPKWLGTDTESVARAIVDLADRPRGQRVIPALFGVAITFNALWPGLVDRLVARVAARIRASAR